MIYSSDSWPNSFDSGMTRWEANHDEIDGDFEIMSVLSQPSNAYNDTDNCGGTKYVRIWGTKTVGMNQLIDPPR